MKECDGDTFKQLCFLRFVEIYNLFQLQAPATQLYPTLANSKIHTVYLKHLILSTLLVTLFSFPFNSVSLPPQFSFS